MHIQEFFQKLEGSEYLTFIRERQAEGLTYKPCSGLERHHVYLQKYEDGRVDEPDNLVVLSIANHFLAHILLLQSLEKLGMASEGSKTYTVARSTVNMFFKIKWQRLTEEEKANLKDKIPELSEVRNRTVHAPRTEEQRRKASEARKGKVSHYQSEETRKKLSIINKARWTPEYRKKMSEAHKGYKQSREQIEKRIATSTGKPHKKFSEEGKRNCSLGHQGMIWVKKGTVSTQIKPERWEEYQAMGYVRGRVGWSKNKK